MEKKSQIDSLANYIMAEIPGEPGEDQGAGDTAIRLLKDYRSKISIYQLVVIALAIAWVVTIWGIWWSS